jgi:hypothetical protein
MALSVQYTHIGKTRCSGLGRLFLRRRRTTLEVVKESFLGENKTCFSINNNQIKNTY